MTNQYYSIQEAISGELTDEQALRLASEVGIEFKLEGIEKLSKLDEPNKVSRLRSEIAWALPTPEGVPRHIRNDPANTLLPYNLFTDTIPAISRTISEDEYYGARYNQEPKLPGLLAELPKKFQQGAKHTRTFESPRLFDYIFPFSRAYDKERMTELDNSLKELKERLQQCPAEMDLESAKIFSDDITALYAKATYLATRSSAPHLPFFSDDRRRATMENVRKYRQSDSVEDFYGYHPRVGDILKRIKPDFQFKRI